MLFYNSHKFLPKEYEYSIMAGGQCRLVMDLNEFVKSSVDFGCDFNMMKHPCRNCIYKEAEIVIKENIDKSGNAQLQMAKYKEKGFPEDFGLNACGIIGRWNNEKTAEFERLWWDEVLQGSYRDQLSFDYVRWLTGATVHNFPYWETLNSYFNVFTHGTNNRVTG